MSTQEGPFYPGQTIQKDPDAELPYDFNWSLWLGADAAIDDQDVTVTETDGEATPLVVDDSDIVDGDTVRVWLSGGTVGTSYTLRCRVTTDETPPRIDDRSVTIRIRQR